MCKVQDISSDDLSALAIKLKAKLPGGILPPRTEARLCWRALALESTFQLTRLDDNVMAFLNRLDDLAAKGVVEKPAAALLLAVRRAPACPGPRLPASTCDASQLPGLPGRPGGCGVRAVRCAWPWFAHPPGGAEHAPNSPLSARAAAPWAPG